MSFYSQIILMCIIMEISIIFWSYFIQIGYLEPSLFYFYSFNNYFWCARFVCLLLAKFDLNVLSPNPTFHTDTLLDRSCPSCCAKTFSSSASLFFFPVTSFRWKMNCNIHMPCFNQFSRLGLKIFWDIRKMFYGFALTSNDYIAGNGSF